MLPHFQVLGQHLFWYISEFWEFANKYVRNTPLKLEFYNRKVGLESYL